MRWCSRTQLARAGRPGVEHRVGAPAIAARAGGDELLERREFVLRAVSDQPRRDVAVAVELRQRVGRAAVGAATQRIGAVPDQPLDHRNVPAAGGHVQWRFAVVAPGEIRIRAMIEQPVRPAGSVAHDIM